MAKLLQDRDEFQKFCELLASENCRSYLEIGSFSGGSIALAACALPKGSRIVSIDKPWKMTKLQLLQQTLERLKLDGYDTHLLLGDSTELKVVEAAKVLGPFDAVFIDGDHRISYVKRDWENYGSMSRMVGFHDIARDLPKNAYGGPHEVSSFWNEFKKEYRHVEFISDRTRARTDNKAAYGIGVVWRDGA